MAVKHIFFDLDRTLWDFERNSHETLAELFQENGLSGRLGTSEDHFIAKYKEINEHYWARYRKGQITKEVLRSIRFEKTLSHYEVSDPDLGAQLGIDYITRCPLKTHLLPNTRVVLDQLKETHVLHIITNGFEEVQHIKMDASGLTSYFEVMMTSERAGCKKPTTDIFIKAMQEAGARANESLMIGDHYEVDVLGAESVGMKGVLFDPYMDTPNVKSTRITDLAELVSHV